ncbi:hypothetical protein GCM10010308_63440 [Streptomyces vinaceusdrappus]|nr:hypothetical protein GCM10010308_63440 [Streptomyces vinaceusdrappus]
MREPAGDPEVVGWLDTAGLFTPGVLPADAGPCEAGCVGTACRQLCDDADGDGQAGTTYSELWCIRADGSAELSIPYTPIAPIDCTYGCPGSETVTLCDANGPILRRYTWLNGVASYEDFALDGATPHVVTGTVGACTGDSGTPGECGADHAGRHARPVPCRWNPPSPSSSPVTAVATQDGWLNLLTGTSTSGPPPAGVAACGGARAFDLAGSSATWTPPPATASACSSWSTPTAQTLPRLRAPGRPGHRGDRYRSALLSVARWPEGAPLLRLRSTASLRTSSSSTQRCCETSTNC